MNTQREKRVPRPRTIYSPSDKLNQPSHFLLHFDSTDSYNIALYSSINNIMGNTATLNIRGKKTVATIVTSGTLETCEDEQRKLTRESQQAAVDNSQLGALNYDENEDIDRFASSQQEGLVRTFSSINRQARGKHHARSELDDENIGLIPDADDNDEEFDLELGRYHHSNGAIGTKHQPGMNKKKRKRSLTNGGKSKRQRINVVHNEKEDQHNNEHTDTSINNETNLKDLFNQIENHMVIYQNMVTKTLKRMERKFDYHLGSGSVEGSKILDQYRTEKGEVFKSEYIYEKRDLLRTPAKDIVDFARRTLRILFSPEELKTHILPPNRDHLRRPALDQERFDILVEAIRIKFRLDSQLMQHCFNDLLRTKLSNFLYEERRREARRRLRDEQFMLKQNMLQLAPYDHQESANSEDGERA